MLILVLGSTIGQHIKYSFGELRLYVCKEGLFFFRRMSFSVFCQMVAGADCVVQYDG
jgi:hypothetical protein